jgi:hypothetical protein
MDNQQLFNLVVSIAGFLATFVFYQIMQRLQRSEDALAALRDKVASEFVHKEDYRNDIKELKDMLRQIFDKLDNKQDK